MTSPVWLSGLLLVAVFIGSSSADTCDADSCGACLLNAECGFCDMAGEGSFCSPGSYDGPAKLGACTEQGGTWRFTACDEDRCAITSGCSACVGAGCGFCADSGTCQSERATCSEWLSEDVDCSAKDPALAPELDLPCHERTLCSDCVSLPAKCKYCVAGVGCVPIDSEEVCDRSFVTQETESECPATNVDDSNVLKPFACCIVLISFLIAFV